ncbi:hypothetical protein [Rhodobacter capsulatus]|uniref:hypothetical protein n=1 Tax=Rhodobacter capsulatus TaxID=1061 RepID=UPI0003D3AA3E|nr:hypothetical protein [Rhodobacter capsulatus]ETD89935.1 hypothetical protein U713_07365 [Rhodobacter capsulatus YW2]
MSEALQFEKRLADDASPLDVARAIRLMHAAGGEGRIVLKLNDETAMGVARAIEAGLQRPVVARRSLMADLRAASPVRTYALIASIWLAVALCVRAWG